MTRDDLIEKAAEALYKDVWGGNPITPWGKLRPVRRTHFIDIAAANLAIYEPLIRADEREACAQVAERAHGGAVGCSDGDTYLAGTNLDAAAAIRARMDEPK